MDRRKLGTSRDFRPQAVHLSPRPYKPNSALVNRSLTSVTNRPQTAMSQNSRTRDPAFKALKHFEAVYEEKKFLAQKKLNRDFENEGRLRKWKTIRDQQNASKVKTKNKPDKQIVEKIWARGRDNSTPSNLNGKIERCSNIETRPIIRRLVLPKEDRAVLYEPVRFYYWG